MTIRDNLEILNSKVREACLQSGRNPQDISLIAVTKNQSLERIKEAFDEGLRDFAETRIQEAIPKIEALSPEIRWHFIGRLQKNKIPKIVGKFVLIHSVENTELAEKISEVSLKQNLVSSILLEVNTSEEQTKGGLSVNEWRVQFPQVLKLKGISIKGLMTLAPLTEEEAVIRTCFSNLRLFNEELSQKYDLSLPILSMGMSNDFQIAIEEGSTHIRIGSALFSPI